MTMIAFDHVNVVTANLDGMVAWYSDVLGLVSGKRPDFRFPGAWMYLGDTAIVHLVAAEQAPKVDEMRIEHFALRAEGFDAFLARLDARGEPYQLADVPGFGVTQVNIHDPDGNHIHIDFQRG